MTTCSSPAREGFLSRLWESTCPADLVEVMYFNFKLRQQFYGFSAQYGVFDNLDVGIFIPIVQTDFKGKAVSNFFAQVTSGHAAPKRAVASKGNFLELKNDGQLHLFRNLNDLRERTSTRCLRRIKESASNKTYGHRRLDASAPSTTTG